MTQELVAVQKNLPPQLVSMLEKEPSALEVFNSFENFFSKIDKLQKQADSIIITDPTQIKEMNKARQLRLEIKNARVETTKIYRALKDEVNTKGKLLDGFKNIIEGVTKPVEAELEKKEKYAELLEKQRLLKIHNERLKIVEPYNDTAFLLDLSEMSQKDFDKFVLKSKQEHEEARALEKKIKEEEEKQARYISELEKENRELKNSFVKTEIKTSTVNEIVHLLVSNGVKKELAEDLAGQIIEIVKG